MQTEKSGGRQAQGRPSEEESGLAQTPHSLCHVVVGYGAEWEETCRRQSFGLDSPLTSFLLRLPNADCLGKG